MYSLNNIFFLVIGINFIVVGLVALIAGIVSLVKRDEIMNKGFMVLLGVIIALNCQRQLPTESSFPIEGTWYDQFEYSPPSGVDPPPLP